MLIHSSPPSFSSSLSSEKKIINGDIYNIIGISANIGTSIPQLKKENITELIIKNFVKLIIITFCCFGPK